MNKGLLRGPHGTPSQSTAAIAQFVSTARTGLWAPIGSATSGSTPGVSSIYSNTLGVGVARPFALSVASAAPVFSLEVTTAAASGLLRFAVYADSGPATPLTPGSLIADLGTIDASTTGHKTLTSPVGLAPFTLYWFAVVLQGAIGVQTRAANVPGLEMPNSSNSVLSTYAQASQGFNGVTGAFPAVLPLIDAGGSTTAFQNFPRVLVKP